jgi:1,4-alpha-glucan branching enzyme
MKNFYLQIIKNNSILILVILMLLGSSFSKTQAQIYEPDGLRMPGDWNAWANTPGMGGDFDLQKISSGTARWVTDFQYTGTSGAQQFKFVSTSFGNEWGNQWAGNANMIPNQAGEFIYGTPSDPNNSIQMEQNHWYKVIWTDNGYANTNAIFLETASEPVSISQVSQNPMLVSNMVPVSVNASLSAVPSSSEHFFLVYSTNGWTSANLVNMSVSGTTISANIPGQASQTTVEYYLFSSTISIPTNPYDLLSLVQNDNNGNFYTYIVDQVFDCGAHLGLITSEPAFPLEGQELTIFFNAAYGNGGLFDYAGDVYVHTGVITNLSVNSSDWKYVKTAWGENTPETKFTRIEDNLYSLTISDIRQYYGVPSSEQILKLAFVFRSDVEQPGGYYLEHKNADGSDIFADVYVPALNVKILNPSRREPLVSPNTVIPVCVEALQNNQIALYLDNTLLTTETGSSVSYPLIVQSLPSGSHWIKAIATGNTGQARDSVQIYLRGPVVVQELPAGLTDGVNYIDNTTVTLVLSDPAGQKSFAFAIGDYSEWLPNDANYMKRTPDGKHYWVTLSGLESGEEYAYQYFIDGTLKIADAYSEKILDPWNDRWIPVTTYPDLKSYPFDKTIGVVSSFQTNQPAYDWQVPNYTPEALNATQSDLFVYELLVRDFVESRSVPEVQTKLDYLQSLGVNAIELMPVIEFDGNESWGYAPNFFMATDKYYGTKEAYKQLIDACHESGMAVILDIVTNHAYGLNPMVQMYFDAENDHPASNNPWFNVIATHPYSVGYDFNHESPYTRQFFKDVYKYWITEFKVDGFRLDLSKGLTQTNSGDDVSAWSQYDQSRINILTDYYNYIKSIDQDTYVILEHLANNDEEKALANTGMLLWSAMHDHYKQIGMGWTDNSDLSWAFHGNRGWAYPNLMDYMENHDEERLMFEALSYGNSNGDYNIKDSLTALRHQEQAFALFMGIPGPKMIWEFQEMGYDYSIFFGGDRLSNKPPRWDYLNNEARERLSRIVGGMAALRKTDAFRMGGFSSDLSGTGKRIWITHSGMDVVIAANIGASGFDMAPGFTKAGTWYDYFTGESMYVTDAAGHSIYFGPGDYHVFTSVPMAAPFHHLTVKVIEKVGGNAISQAKVTLNNLAERMTDNSGNANFLAAPQPFAIKVEKFGFLPQTVTQTLTSDLQLTIVLEVDMSATPENEALAQVKVFPNPGSGICTIENAEDCLLSIYDIQGQCLRQENVTENLHRINLSGLKSGVYFLHLQNHSGRRTIRLIIR